MLNTSSPPAGFDGWLRRYVTQITTAIGVVVGITGLTLFFHLARGQVETLHEWLGVLFVVVAGLHVLRHRRAFVQMLHERRQVALFGLAAVVSAVVLLVPGDGHEGRPSHRLARLAFDAPLVRVAPLAGIEAEEATRRLTAAGIAVAHPGQSLSGIAAANHAEPERLLALVLGEAPPPRP